MEMLLYPLALLFSVMFTASLLFARKHVRANRQRLIEELQILFFPDGKDATAAFDYVRAKYEMRTRAEQSHGRSLRAPVTIGALLAAAVPYIVLCALGFVALFVPKEQLLHGTFSVPFLYNNLFWTMEPAWPVKDPVALETQLLQAAAVFAAAFLGGYLMTARTLLRAVQNYELNQLMFLQSAAYLAFGLVSGMMLFHIVRLSPAGPLVGSLFADSTPMPAAPGYLLIAFMGGYLPDLGIINLSRRLKVKLLKTVDDSSIAATSITPLEIIDGIDTDVRYRLDQAGFYDVQNLAVANPLLIYVETPYTLYEAFDWVLQAQLCLCAGPTCFRALKEHKVRTSLDLERAVLGDDAPDEFIVSIGRILFAAATSDQAGAPVTFTPDTIRHAVMVMLDDLHVQRMRALWHHIYGQISNDLHTPWIYRTTPGLRMPAAAVIVAEPKPAA